MNSKKNLFSRRNFLKWGGGFFALAAGTLMSQSAIARMINKTTPRQPLGPFFPDDGDPVDPIRESQDFSLPIAEGSDNDLTFVKGRKGKAQGQVIYLRGKVTANGVSPNASQPVAGQQNLAGAVIIMWQASSSGRYNHKGDEGNTNFRHPVTGDTVERYHDPHFQYWGRCISNKDGEFWFKTVVPGFYPAGRGWYRPPHLHFMISAPGIPQLVTQTYFKGDTIKDVDFIQELNKRDGLLRDRRLKKEEQESLIVEYKKDPAGKITDGLVGAFDFNLFR